MVTVTYQLINRENSGYVPPDDPLNTLQLNTSFNVLRRAPVYLSGFRGRPETIDIIINVYAANA